MRLPKDPENWTVTHLEKAIAAAWRAFDTYEAKVDFTWPAEKINDLYRPVELARERALEIAQQLSAYTLTQTEKELP